MCRNILTLFHGTGKISSWFNTTRIVAISISAVVLFCAVVAAAALFNKRMKRGKQEILHASQPTIDIEATQALEGTNGVFCAACRAGVIEGAEGMKSCQMCGAPRVDNSEMTQDVDDREMTIPDRTGSDTQEPLVMSTSANMQAQLVFTNSSEGSGSESPEPEHSVDAATIGRKYQEQGYSLMVPGSPITKQMANNEAKKIHFLPPHMISAQVRLFFLIFLLCDLPFCVFSLGRSHDLNPRPLLVNYPRV